MYAIVVTGGKQYKVEKDMIFKVEKLDVEVGAKVQLPVIMLSDEANTLAGEAVKSAYVEAEVLGNGKDKKVIVYKYKAKKNERKRQGHRQPYSTLKVCEIVKG